MANSILSTIIHPEPVSIGQFEYWFFTAGHLISIAFAAVAVAMAWQAWILEPVDSLELEAMMLVAESNRHAKDEFEEFGKGRRLPCKAEFHKFMAKHRPL